MQLLPDYILASDYIILENIYIYMYDHFTWNPDWKNNNDQANQIGARLHASTQNIIEMIMACERRFCHLSCRFFPINNMRLPKILNNLLSFVKENTAIYHVDFSLLTLKSVLPRERMQHFINFSELITFRQLNESRTK